MLRTKVLLACVCLLVSLSAVEAKSLKVVASIRPLYGIVAAITNGVTTPTVLVDNQASVHQFQLKPSDMQSLQQADIVFWVSPTMESFLVRPFDALSIDSHAGMLISAKGVSLLELDHDQHDHSNGHEEEEHHDEHADEHHDDRADEHHDAHSNEHQAKDDHSNEHQTKDDHDDITEYPDKDAHIWLDPKNAIAMADHIRKVLSELDPQNAAQYGQNFTTFSANIHSLIAEINTMLAPHHNKRALVMHDAYRSFTAGLATPHLRPISQHFEGQFSVADIARARDQVMHEGIGCVLSEPQYPPKVARTIAEGASAKVGVLDPLGTELPIDAELYLRLLRDMAATLRDCLS